MSRQRGIAAVVLLAIFAMILIGVLTTGFGGRSVQNDFDAKTVPVLAAAKEALIDYAASHPTAPGRLPCPDINNDGLEDAPCGAAGANQLGRLPWKTLGVRDLRDGSGECLWYAVSGVFKENPVATTPVNSDTNGALKIVDEAGNAVAGATPESRAIAVIIAPGSAVSTNDRGPAGGTTCGGNIIAGNYLDVDADSGVNNAALNNAAPGLGVDTFVARQPPPPPTSPPSGPPNPFNDRLVYITPAEFFPKVERRVAGEIKKALVSYFGTNAYYPFANDYTGPPYNCTAATTRGLLPRTVSADCSSAVNWLPAWLTNDNWDRLTYYTVDPGCAPPNLNCVGGALTVQNTPAPNNNKKAVVIVAGRQRAGQSRPCAAVADCLDGAINTGGTDVYEARPGSPGFNDVVVVVAP